MRKSAVAVISNLVARGCFGCVGWALCASIVGIMFTINNQFVSGWALAVHSS
ncbi:MFS transporter [Escherichia coli]